MPASPPLAAARNLRASGLFAFWLVAFGLWSAGPIFLERGSASHIGETLEATLPELSRADLEALAGDIPLVVLSRVQLGCASKGWQCAHDTRGHGDCRHTAMEQGRRCLLGIGVTSSIRRWMSSTESRALGVNN